MAAHSAACAGVTAPDERKRLRGQHGSRPSPIVELNRAAAISRRSGPAAALPVVERLVAMGVLDSYHLLYAVHGDLLEKVGRHGEAATAFERGVSLAKNTPERELLAHRARESAARETGT